MKQSLLHLSSVKDPSCGTAVPPRPAASSGGAMACGVTLEEIGRQISVVEKRTSQSIPGNGGTRNKHPFEVRS